MTVQEQRTATHSAEASSRSVVGGRELTHGTLDSRELVPSREFYEAVLGLRCVQHAPIAQLICGRGEVAVVCVKAGDRTAPQGDENRWVVSVGSEAEVVETRRRAAASGLTECLGEIATVDGVTSFVMRDCDANWWEISTISGQAYHAIFRKGDVA